MSHMSISLTPEQQAWIVARGDLAWAKPYVGEALLEVVAGKVLTREEHEGRMDALLASMKP